MIILNSKKAIRNQIKEIRSKLSAEEKTIKDQQIYHRLIQTDEFIKSETILIYLNTLDEVSTHLIIEKAWELGKQVAAPKVKGKQMDFYSFTSFNELKTGDYGILEPKNNEVIESQGSLMIMPGVAFDYRRNRIGYGGGYYDRYLTSHPIGSTIALAYSCQLVEQLPYETHDIKPNFIITESSIL